jgi:hypothetical protein|tara:strand:+ start:2429 stop:3418 length:990 start_codon:yes stop_codon:yes gene_type:complete
MKISHMSCTEILIVSLTVTSSIGLLTYFSDTRTSGHQAYDEQKQVLTERATAFTEAKKSLIDLISQHLKNPEFKEKSIKVLSSKKRLRPVRPSADSNINGDVDTAGIFQTNLEAESISILTAGAIVALSTESKKTGRYQPVQNTTTYIDPEKSSDVGLRFFKDPRAGRPTATIALPIRDDTNKRRGYYYVDINPKILHGSMFIQDQSSILSPPENTHAVAYTSLNQITEIYKPIDANQYPPLKSEGINNALNDRPGTYLYLNHQRKPVVGAYQYIPAANMGLLIEREQSVLFKQARRRLIKILITGFSISGIAFLALKQLKAQNSKKVL